jgi:aminopeptidase-like protein
MTPEPAALDRADLRAGLDLDAIGRELYGLVRELYPLCRSLTGNGLRATLDLVGRHIPLALREVPTGTPLFDWTVPKEWNVRDAYIKNARGERVVDFQRSNLHVLQYSVPVARRMTLDELRPHLHTLPEHPEWTPYRTAYYGETWGFCLPHRQLSAMAGDEEYEVCIDATLADGALTYGECHLPGEEAEEVLVSAHACHPSLCNDNLSGLAVSTLLARHLSRRPRRYSYRMLFAPGTIGALAWLQANEERLDRVRHGLVLACVGDPGPSTYKKSRRGDAEIDRAVLHVLRSSGRPYTVMDFSPDGYDERQFCAPAFDLPVGCLMRTPHGRFAEYHTSADDLELVRPAALADSFATCLAVCDVLEHNRTFLNQSPKGEPQLGRRGLYRAIGGPPDPGRRERALLWVLNLSDGRHSLLDIAERSGLEFGTVRAAAQALAEQGLLKEAPA